MKGQRQQFTWYDEVNEDLKWASVEGQRSIENPMLKALREAIMPNLTPVPESFVPRWVDLEAIEREAASPPVNWQRFYLNRITDEVSEDRYRKRYPRGGTGGRPVQHTEEGRTGEADHQPAPPPCRRGCLVCWGKSSH